MSRYMLFVSLLIGAASVMAQPSNIRQEGKVVATGPTDTLWVEIHQNHNLVDRVPVSRDGTFAVHAAHSTLYELRVLTSHGDRITTDYIQFRQAQPVEVRLPVLPGAGAAPAGPISALRLSHKPSKAARKLLRDADSLTQEGNLAAAAERLEKAVILDPAWFEAWNTLGARRLSLSNFAGAAEAFRHALTIDANSPTVQCNLGLALLFQRLAPEAESVARRALQLEPDSARATYVLGLSLLQQERDIAQALTMLNTAAAGIPRAHLATAEWRCRHNDLNGCAADINQFLRTPNSSIHEKAREWLGRINRQLAKR